MVYVFILEINDNKGLLGYQVIQKGIEIYLLCVKYFIYIYVVMLCYFIFLVIYKDEIFL